MKIVCRHGHYGFFPDFSTEISSFCSYFKVSLTRYEDFFTFPGLRDLPRYSIKGKVYADGLPAVVNFEGSPWAVMLANSWVYSLALGRLVPRASITIETRLLGAGDFSICPVPLVQAGALVSTGKRIVDYLGFFADDYQQLRISEAGLV